MFQFNLGAGAVSIISASTYNDNTWHSVEAGRLGKMGILKIDREVVEESTAPGDATDLEVRE
jgi:Laminin G domain.